MEIRGARPAERGEFTRRAFGAGRLSLTEVEGLADLLAAESQQQRRQALAVMKGSQEAQYAAWREEIASCRAWAEAAVDFGDDVEGDVDAAAVTLAADSGVLDRVARLRDGLRRALEEGYRGEAVRDGVRVVLAGAPNAGKSSLLNALAGRAAAIVSPEPGTTRDVVEVQMRLGGLPVVLFDTAGLRDAASGLVEAEGIRRTREAASRAHVVLLVIDAASSSTDDAAAASSSNAEALALLREALSDQIRAPQVLVVLNKVDLILPGEEQRQTRQDHHRRQLLEASATNPATLAILKTAPWLLVSATEETGLETLIADLDRKVADLFGGDDEEFSGEAPAITRARHRRHVERAANSLDDALDRDLPEELRAEELRTAALELGRVVGAIDVEDVLDVLFRDFCIGK